MQPEDKIKNIFQNITRTRFDDKYHVHRRYELYDKNHITFWGKNTTTYGINLIDLFRDLGVRKTDITIEKCVEILNENLDSFELLLNTNKDLKETIEVIPVMENELKLYKKRQEQLYDEKSVLEEKLRMEKNIVAKQSLTIEAQAKAIEALKVLKGKN
jgi:hypothetical protein